MLDIWKIYPQNPIPINWKKKLVQTQHGKQTRPQENRFIRGNDGREASKTEKVKEKP